MAGPLRIFLTTIFMVIFVCCWQAQLVTAADGTIGIFDCCLFVIFLFCWSYLFFPNFPFTVCEGFHSCKDCLATNGTCGWCANGGICMVVATQTCDYGWVPDHCPGNAFVGGGGAVRIVWRMSSHISLASFSSVLQTVVHSQTANRVKPLSWVVVGVPANKRALSQCGGLLVVMFEERERERERLITATALN